MVKALTRAPSAHAAFAAALAALALAGCLPEPTPFQPGVVGGGDTGGNIDGGGDTAVGGTDGGGTVDTVPDNGAGGGCKSVADCKGTPSNQCRVLVCKADGTCGEGDKDDNTGCDDGNVCTVDDRCQKGACAAGQAKDCDDGNGCTKDSCESADGSCAHTNSDGAACDDGEKCTSAEVCQDGACSAEKAAWICVCKPDAPAGDKLNCAAKDPADKCKGQNYCHRNDQNQYVCDINPATVANCPPDQDSECLKNWCDPKVGTCAMTPVETINKSPTTSKKWPLACQDDNGACTTNDTCSAGVCESGTLLCECTVKDLSVCKTTKGLKDDPCLGKVYCKNAGVGPYQVKDPLEVKEKLTHCAINPATVVTCPNANDTNCIGNVCNIKDGVGSCAMTPINTGKLCDDGNPCTANEACSDKGLCAADAATSICKCKGDADCAVQEDGDACNGTLYCDKVEGGCVLNPASVVGQCPNASDTQCIQNICYPALGVCKLTPSENIFTEKLANGFIKTAPYPVKKKAIYCDDSDPCTPVDECTKGVCVADDTNICFCNKDADCGEKGTGNVCDGKLYCDKSSGQGVCKLNPATKVTCSSASDTQCAKNVCDGKTGVCALTPVKGVVLCDDGDACTAISDCKDGKCLPGTPICPCKADADCKDDGNVCNGVPYCNKLTGECKNNLATVKSCNAGNDTECLANACNVKTGACEMKPRNNFKACDIGDPCLASPVCVDGTCFAESNLCQCKEAADCASFDTGNPCLGKPYCDKSVPGKFACKINPGTTVTCQDLGDACRSNVCDKTTGKCAVVNKPSGFILCEDGNACTAGDTCIDGTCASGTAICGCASDADCAAVDDGNPCNGKVQCLPDAKDPGKKFCQVNPGTVIACEAAVEGSCLISKCNAVSGKCESASGAKCSDSNPCTLDTCDSKTDACVHAAVADGTACGGAGFSGVCAGDGKGGSSCIAAPVADAVFIAAGSGFRGCSSLEGSSCAVDETPQHEVTFAKGIWYSQFEVTVAGYEACIKAGDCKAPAKTGTGCTFAGADKTLPLTCVTAAEATTYCGWLAKPSGKTGRLPTEAEYERAARGGCELFASGSCQDAVRTFPWGEVGASCAMAVMAGTSTPGCDTGGVLAPGARPNDRSLYDLYDLGGNVSEWVNDAYQAGAYAIAGNPAKDPLATGAGAKVVRGGNFKSPAADLRAGKRASSADAAETIGFRCVIVQ